MWLLENHHFVAILRCAKNILLAYFCTGGATIFLSRLDITTDKTTSHLTNPETTLGSHWL